MAAKKDRKVRVLVGTRKGAYILEGDRARTKWAVKGPFHAGSDVFHVAADPRHPGELYAAVNNAFFGPMLQKSTNWGATWKEVATPMMPMMKERPSPFDGTPGMPKHALVNLWRIEPGRPEEPDTVYVGADPGMLFVSRDRGRSWSPMTGLTEHRTREKWNPGAGGMCTHTILWDPMRKGRMYAGISAAGFFRSDDDGATWTPKNVGVEVSFQPEKRPEVGQCVHHVVLDPATPDTLYRQDHDGIFVSHDAGDQWTRIGRSLFSDFGFVAAVAPALPGTAFFVPLTGEARLGNDRQLQVYKWTEKTRKWTPTIKGHPFPGDLGTHREGFAADALDPAGLYLGTTTGQLFWSRDGAAHWNEVPFRFPGIHSVSVASPDGT